MYLSHFLSFCFSFSFFHLVYLSSHYFSASTFKKWNFNQQAETAWNSRVVSSVHAVIAAQAALRCVLYSTANPVYGTCDLLEDYLPISLGYLTYDLLMCVRYPNLRELSMLIHHTAAISLELYYLEFRYGVLWTSYYLLFEITTPLLNLLYHFRKVELDRLDYWPHTFLFFSFYFMWILFRVWPCLYLWMQTYVLWTEIKTLVTFKILFIFLSLGLFTVLNFYWFVLITKKLVVKLQSGNERRGKSFSSG